MAARLRAQLHRADEWQQRRRRLAGALIAYHGFFSIFPMLLALDALRDSVRFDEER